jgi:hypothetical protein
MKKQESDISHEQGEIISRRRYKTKKEQKAFYAGWMECAKRADVTIMEVLMHCQKEEAKVTKFLSGLAETNKK